MPVSSCGVSVIPDAQKAAYNLICAAWYGDPPTTQNLSQPLIPATAPDAQPDYQGPPVTPPTHWFGGLGVDAAWIAAFGPGAPVPSPPGGWPYMVDGIVMLTEAAADIAWAARDITVRVGANAEELPMETLGIVLSVLELARPPAEL